VSSEFFQTRALREKTPRPVMAVLVKSCLTSLPRNVRDFFNQELWIGDKTKDPSAPCEIKRPFGQSIIHQVELVNVDIRKRSCLNRALDRFDNITRALDCGDSAGVSNNCRKIDSRIAGPGTAHEHPASNRDGRR